MNRAERRARRREAERKGLAYMGIVKGYTKTVEDPYESGRHVTVKMLSYLELEEARQARIAALAKQAKDLPQLSAVAQKSVEERAAEARKARAADPLVSYDVATLLRHGVVAWDYEGVEPDTSLFDERTARHVARAILEFSNPEEDDLGKASSRSTDTSPGTAQPPSSGV